MGAYCFDASFAGVPKNRRQSMRYTARRGSSACICTGYCSAPGGPRFVSKIYVAAGPVDHVVAGRSGNGLAVVAPAQTRFDLVDISYCDNTSDRIVVAAIERIALDRRFPRPDERGRSEHGGRIS